MKTNNRETGSKIKLLVLLLVVILSAGMLIFVSNQDRLKTEAAVNLAKYEYLLQFRSSEYSLDYIQSEKRHAILESIEDYLNYLTPRQLAGSLFMVSIPDKYLSQTTIDFINRNKLYGVIIMGSNIDSQEQLSILNNDLHTKVDHKLLIAVDQEGGIVARVWWETNAGLSASQLAQLPENEMREAVSKRAAELKQLGFDINFAPVADITYPGSVMTSRNLGADPAVVSRLLSNILPACNSEGISCTLKHYPGLGRGSLDTHNDLPTIDVSLEDLQKSDLLPFTAGIAENVDYIMIGHAFYPQLDNQYPASLSKKIQTGILREQQNFEGLIISDDLKMGALKSYENRYAQAVNAGTNILLLLDSFNNIESAINQVVSGVDSQLLRSRARYLLMYKYKKSGAVPAL